jgi:signal transduction histidine kinase
MYSHPTPANGLNMPSRTTWRILIPTFAVSGLLLAVGVGGAWYVHRVNREVSDSLDENLAAAQSEGRLVLTIREVRLELGQFAETSEPSHLTAAQSWLELVERELRSGGLEISDGDSLGNALQELQRRLASLLVDQDLARQRTTARELMATLSRDFLPLAEERLVNRQELASETSRQNQLLAKRIGIGLLMLGICGAAAGMLFGFGIARSIHRSLVQISIPVQDMAGRLNEVVGPIVVQANTDLSGLDDSLRMLSEKTADVVRRLQDSQHQSLKREQLAAVGQLAAGLAHELRNPLMSVNLILQTAAERDDESLNKRDREVIQDEVSRLERMLKTFLDFARPPRPQKLAVDVNRLVEATVEVVRLRATQQDVQLHCPATAVPVSIEADELQMRQLLLNLLLNALDALPRGGNVWLDVSDDKLPFRQISFDDSACKLRTAADGNGQPRDAHCVKIRIADDGPGLSPEVLERLFEPFVSTKDTGIGLGLSICQRIVESHDGRITAGNRRGGGAEFTIFLLRSVSASPHGDSRAQAISFDEPVTEENH